MTKKRQTLLLVLLVILGCGFGLWFAGGSAPPADTEIGGIVPTQDSGALAPEGPERAAPLERTDLLPPTEPVASEDTTSTVVFPLMVEASLIQRGAFEEVEGVQRLGSGANARLRGSILLTTGKPLPARVTFREGPNEGRVLTCDSSGAFGASDLYQGYSIVHVEVPGVGSSEREVLLRQLAEAQLNVTFGRPASVAGLVKDREGAPIEGARVRLDGGEATTDDQGAFYFPTVTPGQVLAVVDKPGFTMYRESVHVEMGGAVARDRMTFTLREAASLEVSIQERLGSGPAKLYVFPAGGQPANAGVGQRAFPWHKINPTEIPPGGTALIDGLPDTSVTLLLFQPGAVAKPRMVNKRLYGGRKNSIVLHLEPAAVVRGTVSDEAGKPVPRARVRLEAPDRSMATTKVLQKRPTFNMEMILPHLPSALQEVTTDVRGRFTFTAYEDVRTGTYLTAESQDGSLRATRVVSPGTSQVDLTLRPASKDLGSLELQMAGRFQGLPVNVRVNGAPRDPFVLSASDELVLEDLEAGTWRLDVRWRGQYEMQNQIVTIAPADQASLKLVLPRGALEGQTDEERRRAGFK